MPAGGVCGLKLLPKPEMTHPLKAVLEQVGPSSCPTTHNFHCHTVCSDGSLEPLELIQQATELGLQHLAVTDHHSSQAHREIRAWLNQQRGAGAVCPMVWSGMEISALLKGCLVHVLALGFELHHPALQPYNRGDAVVGEPLRAEAVVKAIHAAGGLAILAHPARYRLDHDVLINEAARLGFDGGEAWYDYDMQTTWSASPLICDSIDRQLGNLGLLRTCGTDTHGIDLRGR